MNIVYNIGLFLAILLAGPYYLLVMLTKGKYRKSVGAKFGIGFDRSGDLPAGRPRIWIHAVSVGEVTAAAPIVTVLRELSPDAFIAVSTSTETGQQMAKGIIAEASSIFYYPLDFPFVVRKMIRRVRPDVFVMTETELWPNFIRICREEGVKVVMVNGRISPRSFGRYHASRLFWRDTLRHINAMAMISDVDAERIVHIGMDPARVRVLGNAKYDGLAARVSDALAREIAEKIGMQAGEQVFVAGSTHEGEEDVVLDVYGRLLSIYPDMKLIIVPRHVDRGRTVLDLVKAKGYADSIAISEIHAGRMRTNERVIVVDVIGELFKIYSLATVVFCGGSLVPKGGQNILEAAAWGKIVFYGPSMEDFQNERKLLEDIGAGIPINNGQELLDGIVTALGDPLARASKETAAREVIAANRGSARQYAAVILDVLNR